MSSFAVLRVQHHERIEQLEAAQRYEIEICRQVRSGNFPHREAVMNLATEQERFAAEVSAKERELCAFFFLHSVNDAN